MNATLTTPSSTPAPVPSASGRIRHVPFRAPAGSRLDSAGRILALLAIVHTPYYLVWRSMTLNPSALWFSVPVLAAEALAAVLAGMVVFERWRMSSRAQVAAPRRRAVDVYVVARDEPLDAVRRSALAARALTYPHRTWLLDGERRPEVRAMARELGVDHVSSVEGEGDIVSRALRSTRGEFVLLVEAGCVPLPHVIDRLLGYFAEDGRLAFAQPVVEPVAMAGSRTRAGAPDAVTQRGRDRMNAAQLTGGCALVRRRAIEDLPRMASAARTSIALHARGWRSVYHHEALAWQPASMADRRGTVGLVRPILMRGLTPGQRVSYLSASSLPIAVLVRLTLVLAPIVMLATGVLPVRTLDAGLFLRLVPFALLWFVALRLLARGTSPRPWWRAEVDMLRRVIDQVALRAGRSPDRRPEHRQEEMFPVRYRVLNRVRAARWQTGLTENLSPRGLAYRSLEVAPVGTRLSLLLRLTTTTVGVTGRVVHVRRETAGGVTFFRHGVRFEGVADLAREAILMHVSWHAAPLAGERSAISDRALLPARDRRADARTHVALPAELVVHEPDGQLVDELAVLEDVSPAGARLVTERRIATGATVRFQVPGSAIEGAGTVAHATPVSTPLGERWITGLTDVVGLTPPRELIRPSRARALRARAG